MSLHFPHNPTNLTIKSYDYYKETSPAQKLFHALISKGIIDHEGNILASKENAFISAENFYESISRFWETENTIEFPGTDIKVKLKLIDLINYLVDIDPNVSLDLIEQTALNFLGFEFIDQLYRHWGIDLVEVCGPDYVEELKRELNRFKSIHIMYGIGSNDPEKVNQLVRGVIDCIGDRVPNEAIPALQKKLTDKKDTYYQFWLKDDLHANLIPRIATEEFVAQNTVYPKSNSSHPFGGLAVALDNGTTLDLRFCDFHYWVDLCHKSNKVRLPLKKMESVSETKEFLKDYYDGYIRGVVNLTCRKRISSELHTMTSKTCYDLCLGTIKGETASGLSDKANLIRWLLHFSQQTALKTGKPVGISIGTFLNQLDPEKITNKEFFALVINCCELLSENLSQIELNNLIHITSERWKICAEQDDGSIFYPLAKAILEGTSYEVISAYLKLCANALLKEQSNPHIRAWRNETSGPYGYQGITQLEISHEKPPIYLNIENHQNLINIFDYNLRSNQSALGLLTNRLLNNELDNTLTFENIYFENFEVIFSKLLEKFHNYSSQDPVNTKEYFKQLCLFLNSQNSCLSQEEKTELKKLQINVTQNDFLSSEEIISLLIRFLGDCENNIIPNAIYKLFKITNSLKLKTESIKSMIQTDLLYAIRAFNRLKDTKLVDTTTLENLLDEIMTAFEKHPNSLLYIDMLSKELESILKTRIKFSSADWLKEQLIRVDKGDLATLISTETQSEAKVSSPQEDEKKWDVESLLLEADAILSSKSPHWAKTYGRLLQEIHKNQTLKIERHLWWEKFIFPALEMAKSSPWQINCEIQIHAINSLKAYTPNKETFEKLCTSFTGFLKQVNFNQSFPSVYKKALFQNIDHIFENLEKHGLHLQMVDFAREIGLHGWIEASDRLLNGFLQALKQSPEVVRNIHELVNDAALKQKWAELKNSPQLFAQLCEAYAKDDSLIAFDYFDKCPKPSTHLVLAMLNLCGTHQNGKKFAEINEKLGSISDEKLTSSWKVCFAKVFGNLNEKNIIALNEILLSANASLLNAERIIIKLKNISPLVPYFGQVLNCLLNVLEKNSIQANQVNPKSSSKKGSSKKRSSKSKPAPQNVTGIDNKLFCETLSLIKFTRDKRIISKAFHLIKNRKLNSELSKLLWNILIEKIDCMDEKCLAEILKNHSKIPCFDLKETESLQNFSRVFKAYEHLVTKSKNKDPKKGVDLKTLLEVYKFIEGSKLVDKRSLPFCKIQLIYGNILTLYKNQHAEALKLLKEALNNYFVEDDFIFESLKKSLETGLQDLDLSIFKNHTDKKWDSDLVLYFKKIIKKLDKNIFKEEDLIFIYGKTSVNFNFDAFIHFANRVNQIRTEAAQPALRQIINRMLSIKELHNTKQLTKLKKLSENINLKKQLDWIIYNDILHEPFELFKTLFSNDLNKFLSNKDIAGLQSNFLEVYFDNVLNKGNDVSCYHIINALLNSLDDAIRGNYKIVSKIIQIYNYFLSENVINFNDYEATINKINDVWPMWSTHEEKLVLNNNFYIFLNLCVNTYNKNSDKQYFSCLSFLAKKLKLGMENPRNFNNPLYGSIAKLGIKLFDIMNKFEQAKSFIEDEQPDFKPLINEFAEFLHDKPELPPICEMYKSLLRESEKSEKSDIHFVQEENRFNQLLHYLIKNPSKTSIELALLTIKKHLPDAMRSFDTLLEILKTTIAQNQQCGSQLCYEINYLLNFINIVLDNNFKDSPNSAVILKKSINKLIASNFKSLFTDLNSKKNYRDSIRIILDFQSIVIHSHNFYSYQLFQKIMNNYFTFCKEFLSNNQINEVLYNSIAQGFVNCLWVKPLDDSKTEQIAWRNGLYNEWTKFLNQLTG